MKKTKKEDLRKRIMAYSAAAAGVLAIAPQANAAIQYSGPQNLNVNLSTSQSIDINGDGQDDFNFAASSDWIYMTGLTNYFAITSNEHIDYNNSPARLASNYLIQNTLANASYYWDNESSDTLASKYGNGNFNNATGYIGVRFETADGTRYGWIQFRGDTSGNSGTIIDWAYEDSGASILAGATGTAAATIQPVPAVGEWGALAMAGLLGGAAVNHLRRRKKEKK